ncbi:phage tail tape measure protein [Acetobacter orientalis]|uniref:phage tail tape measure protein n=1 Tax=Acetobacter orientalis TaxID=146474 RepID=UPI00241F3DC2|nr:phage tail tape measure protein [Acetobacter orientalis]
MNEALGSTGGAATEATESLARMGAEADEAASRVSSAMERAQAAYRAASEMARLPGPSSSVSTGGVSGSVSGYLSRVGGGAKGFHEAVNDGVGKAFGAAAAGFGVLAPVHAAAEYDNDLTHIGIGLRLYGEKNRAFVEAFGNQIDALARQTGQRGGELVSAAAFFGREGYTGKRLDAILPTVARISTAYTSNPKDVAQSAFAVHEGLQISDAGLQQALATMALSGKIADMPMEELSREFPVVEAQAAAFGVRGQKGLVNLLSALAVTRKNSSSLGSTVANLGQLLVVPQSTAGVKNFAKLGVDINKLKKQTLANGGDLIQMLLQTIDRVTDHTNNATAMQTLFHNVQDRAAAAAIIQHWKGNIAEGDLGYTDVQAKLRAATPEEVNKDYLTGLQSTKIKANSFDESLVQIERRIGKSFVPVISVATKGLNALSYGFDQTNAHTHGAASIFTAGIGSVLGLTAAVGALGAIMVPLRAGLKLVDAATGGWLGKLARLGFRLAKMPFARVVRLLLTIGRGAALAAAEITPIGWALTAVTAAITAGYLAWRNWDKIKPMLSSLGNWIAGWTRTIGSYIYAAVHPLDKWFDQSAMGQSMDKWLAHPAVPAGMPAGGHTTPSQEGHFSLHVSHEDGVKVKQTSGRRDMVTITPDRGRMVGKP